MNFFDYFKYTKVTTISCLKISGVIFTSIFAVIALITGFRNESIVKTLEFFGMLFIVGNGFGFFIWIVAIWSDYKQLNANIEFYNSIPIGIKEKFGLYLYKKTQNPKYNFFQLEIISTESDCPFIFNFDKKHVRISIFIDLSDVENFQNRIIEIEKKYKTSKITLNGWGLCQNIEKTEWSEITSEKVNQMLEKLITVSNEENLKIEKRMT